MQPISSSLQSLYFDLNALEPIEQQSLANLVKQEKEMRRRQRDELMSKLSELFMPDEDLAEYSTHHVTRRDINRYIDVNTRDIRVTELYLWLGFRLQVSPEIKHDEWGFLHLPSQPVQRKACLRDLTKFGFPELPLTEEERQCASAGASYKFQVRDSIVFVPDTLMDYIQEKDLYRDDESAIMKRARKSYWGYTPGNLSEAGFQEEQYMEKHHHDEFMLIWLEMNALERRAYNRELPWKVRLSRAVLIPAVKAKLVSIVHQALHALRCCWPLHTRLRTGVKVTILFTSLNLWGLMMFHYILKKESRYEQR